MRVLYCLLLWVAFMQRTTGQSLKIESIGTSCLATETSVTYSSTATFAADNQFTIELRSYYNNTLTRTFPATLKNGQLVFTIRDLNSLGNATRDEFEARIVSTKPALQSNWSTSFRVNRPAVVTLTGSTVQAVNPSESVGLRFAYEGSWPLTVVLTDSTKFILNDDSYAVSGTSTRTLTPKATTTFRIAQVSNSCGVGVSTGSVTVGVNPIGVRTTAVSAPQLCIGSDLYVSYSTLGGNFSATNQFKIRLTALNTSTNQEDPAFTYDLPATPENGRLKATIPVSVPAQPGYTGSYYTVRVLSTAPATFGDHAGYRIEVRPTPTVEFRSGSRTINPGETVDIDLKFQGLAPFSARLSDGTVVQSGFNFDDVSRVTTRPIQTTTYTVASLQTGCGPVTAKTTGSVVVTVNPGIAIDSVTSAPICEGQSLRIKFSQNQTTAGSNQYFVRIRYGNDWTTDPIPAQQQGSYLTFTVPALQLPTPAATTFRNQNFSLQVSSTQPVASSAWWGSLSILTRPGLNWSTFNTYTIDRPQQQIGWGWTGTGGGAYQLEMETGEKSGSLTIWEAGSTVYLPAIETRTFRVKSIRNACFTTDNPAQATLTVKSTEGRYIYVKPFKSTVCRGDSLELTFQALGSFEPGNLFRVQTRPGSFCCDFTDALGSTTHDGTVRLKIPTNIGWNSDGAYSLTFRIASTNPVVFSAEFQLTIHQPPYDIRFGDKNEVLLLKPATVSGQVSYYGGTPMTINYAIGNTDYSLTTSTIYGTEISFPVNATNTFTLKSLANACGPVPGNKVINYRVVPYLLQTTPLSGSSYQPATYCAGTTLTLPYQMAGQPDPNGSVSLQFREAKATTFRTLLANVKDNPVVLPLPDTLQAGDYVIRLMSNLAIASAEQTIRINRKATAQLTTETGATAVEIGSGNNPYLKVNLTGTPDWTVFFSDGQRQTYTSSPGTRPVAPASKTVYTLSGVTNACGYGSTVGDVTVSVKPTLSLSTSGYFFCKGAKIPVPYVAQGDFGPGNQLKIGLLDGPNGTTVRWLDSTTTARGTFLLTLPGSLTLGTHYLRLTATNPAQSITTSFQLSSTPSLTLGGSTVINPQQSATIRLMTDPATTEYTSAIRYTFANGLTGEFIPRYYSGTYDLTVQPTQTTTYQLTSVSNTCGIGQVSGSATITVNPPADRQINTRDVLLRSGSSGLCAGDTVQVSFESQGLFSATNRFTVQLSDSTGTRFADLSTVGTASPLRALVPASLPRGSFYRVRVVASDGGNSSTNPIPLRLRYSATAAFESALVAFEPGKTTKVGLTLTGDAPWLVQIGNEFNPTGQLNIFNSPYTIELSPTAASTTYKLYRVSNVCGNGRLVTPSVVQISVLTAIEPAASSFFSVYPNPTNGWLRISRPVPGKPGTFQLTDLNGRVLIQQRVMGTLSEQDLSGLPGGVYLLRLDAEGHQATYRILKQ